jgi:ubiquinone/menaquinone biosynthesis C-methylase UbiE
VRGIASPGCGGMNYDQTNIPENYNRGRDHGAAFLQQWMSVVSNRVDLKGVHDILDLGCGTGRFSDALAHTFHANLMGIDPSTKMLQQARGSNSNSRIVFANGFGEAVPLPADSMDLIFISMAFHHFNDPRIVAEECRRVLRRQGRVCLRTASLEKIPMYPYVPFFPTSRKLLEQRLPSLTFQREVFEEASFQTLSYEVVAQTIAADYSSYADKLSLKADSILASLDDCEFEAGLHALRSAATTMPACAITEPIDFFVFGKSPAGS